MLSIIKNFIFILVSALGFLTTFYSVGKIMIFLSMPNVIQPKFIWVLKMLDQYSRFESILTPMTINLLLITLFILQHSLMRTNFIKSCWTKIGFGSLERSIYVLSTSGILLLMITNWKPLPAYILWHINVENNNILWWTFATIHIIAWAVIYGGCIILDLPEILGIKQVFYAIKNLPPPSSFKSKELNNLHNHVRHPSFTGIFFILWLTNIMSLDRFILAILWTLYMYVAWNTNQTDVDYQKYQMTKKKENLKYLLK